jgi:hypothetical protein
MSTLTATQLQQQYIAYFGRPGDPAGIKYWLSSSSGISSAREFADKIYAQDEYKTSTVGGKSTEEQVNSLYKNLFGRSADAAGLLYWTGEIEKGALSLSNVAYDLIWAASNPVSTNSAQAALDASTLSNKVAAATAYTAEVEASTTAILAYQPESSSPWKTGAAFTSAVTYITGIDSTTPHTAAGITSTVSSLTTGSNVTGSTFTLTTSANETTGGSDNFTGTTGADKFLANADAALDNGDVIDGGAGIDTLTARYAVGDAGKTVNASVKNVEIVQIDHDSAHANADTLTVDVNGFTGLTDVIGIDGSSVSGAEDTVNFTNIAAGVNLGVTRGDAHTIYDFDYSDVTGLADTSTIKFDTAKAQNVIVAGVETVTVDTTGKTTLDELNIAAATSLTLTGAGALTITDLDAGTNTALKTIDASAATGAINLTSFIAGDVTVTGGSGDDTFDFSANNIQAADTITGGSGNDTLVVDESLSTALTKVTSVETIKISVADIDVIAGESGNGAGSASIDMSKIPSLTTVIFDIGAAADADAGTITVTKLENGDTIIIDKLSSDTTSGDGNMLTGTFATDTTADNLNLTLSGVGATVASAATGTGADHITLDTVETLNITSNNNSAGTVVTSSIESLNVAEATTINISGAAELIIDGIANTTDLTTIDASALTGKLSITGIDASALTFTGGSNQTTLDITGLTSADTITGGANTKDKLTAGSITGLTATTGKLNIKDIETVALSYTGANTIDASLLSGVTTLSFDGTATGQQTITGVAAGQAIGVSSAAAAADNSVDINVTLADETGTADALTVKVDNTLGGDTDVDLETASTLETVTLDLLDLDTANDAEVQMANSFASKLILTGGYAGASLTLGTLSTSTTTVDATGLDADFDMTAGAVDTGLTVTTAAAQTDTQITLSDKDDTITMASTAAVTPDVDGGGGTDTFNLTISAGFDDTDDIDNIENLNLTVAAGDDVIFGENTSGTADDAQGLGAATTLTILGGNSLSTFTVGDQDAAAADDLEAAVDVDASAFQGNVYLQFNVDIFSATTDVDAGALATDTVYAQWNTAFTGALPLTGVETFIASIDTGNDGSETYTFDVDGATGLKTIAVESAGANTLVINDYIDSVTIQLGTDPDTAESTGTQAFDAASSVDINLKSTGGSSDTVNIGLTDTDGKNHTTDIDSASTEKLNLILSDDAEDHKVDIAGVVASTNQKVSVTVTGGKAGEDLEITNNSTTNNVIDADAALSGLTISDRHSGAMTITGSSTETNNLRMENPSDVLTSGSAADDKLSVTKNAVLGGILVDLSSSTDQVTTFNGSANSAIQKGFEDVDLTGYTGSFGADITAIKGGSDITGTPQADVITDGAGADIVRQSDKGDAISFAGGGIDKYVAQESVNTTGYTATTLADNNDTDGDTVTFGNGVDVITGFGTDDLIQGTFTDNTALTLIGTMANMGASTTNTGYVAYGTWNNTSKVFTVEDDGFVASSSQDALVYYTNGADLAGVAAATEIFVLDDLGAALAQANMDV